LRENQSKT